MIKSTIESKSSKRASIYINQDLHYDILALCSDLLLVKWSAELSMKQDTLSAVIIAATDVIKYIPYRLAFERQYCL